jgi:hypothetical protein
MSKPIINRVWDMPNADTMLVPSIRQFALKYLAQSKCSVDPFARNCRLCKYTNDLNPDTAAEWHLEASDFLRMLVAQQVVADVVVFDPPYSVRQIQEVYQRVGREPFSFNDHEQVGRWNEEKDLISKLLEPGGICLHLGWHTNGMCKERGFVIEEILLVPHGGCRNDTICMAERKLPADAILFDTEAV